MTNIIQFPSQQFEVINQGNSPLMEGEIITLAQFNSLKDEYDFEVKGV